jgi:hypothetical protein
MNHKDIPPITSERWLSNLLGIWSEIADREHQESRWLSPDAYAWEKPTELINVLMDDCLFDVFLKEYDATFSEEQRTAANGFRDELTRYCETTSELLEPAQVLADPRWEAIRQMAATLVAAFRDKWPSCSSHANSNLPIST